MTSIDLSGMNRLRLYDLAKHLSLETKEPLVLWLHRMGTYPLKENQIHTLSNPDAPHCWLIFRHPPQPIDPLDRLDNESAHREKVKIWEDQFLKFRNFTRQMPVSPEDPPADFASSIELLTIDRQDFSRWFKFTFPDSCLPHFWFKDAEDHSASHTASNQMRSQQKSYCSQQEKNAVVKEVVPQILTKYKQGVKWNHLTEIRRYMANHGIHASKEGGLVRAVKEDLRKKHKIECPRGKPPRI